MTQVSFYFDLGSPFAYLAAERIDQVLGEPAVWQPVSLGGLFKLSGRSSWSLGDLARREAGMAEVERRAQLYGLPPIRWPDPWPSNYLFAMRVATYAFQQGLGREFTLRAFRHAFRDGNDLAISKQVLQVAADAGLNLQEAEDATQDGEVKLALRAATDTAHALGVFGVPTIAVGDELFWGDDRLNDAVALRLTAGRTP